MKLIKEFPWWGLIPLTLTVITGNWLADEMKFLINETILSKSKILTLVVSTIIFVISLLWLYSYRKSFLGIRTLQEVKMRPMEGLIILLSTPTPEPETYSFPMTIKRSNGNEVTLKGEYLEEDIEALNTIKWNWQQILRAIKPHKDKLKYLYLIGSKDSENIKGSFSDLDKAEFFIKRYFPYITIIKSDNPVEFENLEELLKVIYRAIRHLKNQGLEEDEIIVDITGGQKITSIAGAVVTMNSRVRFQYVQTNRPFEVIAYDLTIQQEILI